MCPETLKILPFLIPFLFTYDIQIFVESNQPFAFCISFLYEFRPRSVCKNTTFGAFQSILTYIWYKILKHFLAINLFCEIIFVPLKKDLQLEFYCLNVPILKETFPLLTKCTMQCEGPKREKLR